MFETISICCAVMTSKVRRRRITPKERTHLWYGKLALMLNALYICSHNITLKS